MARAVLIVVCALLFLCTYWPWSFVLVLLILCADRKRRSGLRRAWAGRE